MNNEDNVNDVVSTQYVRYISIIDYHKEAMVAGKQNL